MKALSALMALEEAIRDEIKPIPRGWFSRRMLEEEGLSRDQAKEKIAKAKFRGLLEIKKWKTPTGTVPIYHLKST
jgi:hypothetical protein